MRTSLLSHEWWVLLIKFMVEPTIHVRGESAHLWYAFNHEIFSVKFYSKRQFMSSNGEIIMYSRSTINAYFPPLT